MLNLEIRQNEFFKFLVHIKKIILVILESLLLVFCFLQKFFLIDFLLLLSSRGINFSLQFV